jgi:SAM-dependent methyltransferase
VTSPWRSLPGTPFEVRDYPDRTSYLRHQAAEADWERDGAALAERGAIYQTALRDELTGLIPPGSSVLCLGAREGAEVRAFLEHRCFAVGIELAPPPGSDLVLTGDFHALPWPAGTIDVVFTNALDHALDPERLLREVCRLLKPRGRFFGHVVAGTDEGFEFGEMECLRWRRVQDVVEYVARFPLELAGRRRMVEPWPGELIRWRRAA